MASLNIFMHLRVYILWAIFWMCFARQLYAQPDASKYRFQHFDTKDGLSSDLTEHIFQDSLGFLWAAHVWSVSRYDGYNFKTYRYDPDDTVRSLGNEILGSAYLDRSGNFWVGSTNARHGFQINKYDRTIDGFLKYRIFTDGYLVWKVSFEKDNKTLWLSTDNGIYSFNTETQETRNFLNYLPDSLARSLSNNVRDIYVEDATLLVATGKGLWKFDKLLKTFSRPLCEPKDSSWFYHTEFFDIYDERSKDFNNVWLLDNVSLTKVDKDLSVFQRLAIPEELTKAYGRGYDSDKQGVFWFGSWFEGIIRIDPIDNSFINIRSVVMRIYG